MRRFAVVASGLFTCLVACGDDGVHHLADAPPAPDGPADAAPATTVNVTTLARNYASVPARTPESGVLVFAVDPTGALTGMATTGADGKATVPLPSGGSVTVVYTYVQIKGLPIHTVVTYAGVKPGDSLTFGDYTTGFSPTTGQTGAMTISWAAVTNATRYRVYSPCFSSNSETGTTVTVALSTSCQTPTAPVGLAAFDANDNVIASVFLPATPYAVGTTLAIAANQWTAQAAAPNYTINLTNVDAGATSAQIAAFDEFVRGEYGTFWFSYPPQMFTVTPAAGAASQAISIAAAAPRPAAAAKLYHQTHIGRQWFFKAGASPVSINTGAVPWIDTVALDSVMRTLSWTQTAGTYDAATLRFSFGNNTWTVILPPGVTQLDATMAPPEVAQYLPTATDGLNMFGCQLVNLSSAASYDALRALPEWRATTTETAVRIGDEPAATLADCGEGYHF